MGRQRGQTCGRWALAGAIVSALLAACGTPSGSVASGGTSDLTIASSVPNPTASSVDESVVTTDGSGNVSGWAEVDLGPVSGDDYVSLTEHDGEVWAGWLTDERTAFEVRDLAGEQVHRFAAPPQSSPPLLFGTPFGLMLIASDGEGFLPKSYLSTDGGANWTESSISSRPFDVSGVTVVDGFLLAPGAFRPVEQPGMGPFTPGMFRSDDGVDWTEVALDPAVFDMNDSYLGRIVDMGDRLVVSGTIVVGEYRSPALFESADRGATWQVAADTGLAPGAVVAAGHTLVGVNSFLSSSDPGQPVRTNSGREWRTVELSRFGPPFQYASTFALSGGQAALITFAVEPTTDYCYERIDECRSGHIPSLLLVAADGTVMSVDLGESVYPSSGLVAADGSLHVVAAGGDRLVLRSWDGANGPVPTVADVEPFTPNGPSLVEWGSTLEIGSTYRFPLGTHCGIDILGDFNGEHWWIVGRPTEAYDPYQSDMTQRLLGEITLVDATTIEYRLDGELIANYAPSPQEPPGCE